MRPRDQSPVPSERNRERERDIDIGKDIERRNDSLIPSLILPGKHFKIWRFREEARDPTGSMRK
jgi:SRSO17 transposase